MNKKNGFLLIFGKCTSKLGNIIFDYTNNTLISKLGANSTILLAIYQSSDVIINIIFNIIGGVYADKKNRKRILIFTDLMCGIICFIASMFLENRLIAYVLIIANILIAFFSSFNSPTYKAIVKDAIEETFVSKFNSFLNAISEIIKVVSPLIGMFILDIVGIKITLIINALTFLISALAESKIQIEEKRTDKIKEKKMHFFKDVLDGFKYLLLNKKLLFIIIISSLINFFLAGYNLMLPYLDSILHKNNYNLYAIALTYEACGGIIGSLINSKVKSIYDKSEKLLGFFILLTGISLFMFEFSFINLNKYIIVIPILFFGIMLTIFNIRFMTYVQLTVEKDYLGRIFSIIFTIAVLFMPLGSFIFSIDRTMDINGVICVGGGISILGLIVIIKTIISEKKQDI